MKTGDGTVIKAKKVNVDKVGDMTTLSLRPERVEIEPSNKMQNIVNGRIEELIYLGDHIRVRMNVAGNNEFIVKVRNRGDKRELTEGQNTKIGWASADCKALDMVA